MTDLGDRDLACLIGGLLGDAVLGLTSDSMAPALYYEIQALEKEKDSK